MLAIKAGFCFDRMLLKGYYRAFRTAIQSTLRKGSEKDFARFDLWALCSERLSLSSAETGFEYSRLVADGDLSSFSDLQWSIAGRVDGAGESLVTIKGSLQATMTCAHCSKPVCMPIVVARRWLLKANEKMAEVFDTEDLDDDIDVVSCPEVIDLQAWIEDELLLSLPMFARHEACEEEIYEVGQSLPELADISETRKPFANLGDLLAKAKKSH